MIVAPGLKAPVLNRFRELVAAGVIDNAVLVDCSAEHYFTGDKVPSGVSLLHL